METRLPKSLGEWIAELRMMKRKIGHSTGRGVRREVVRPWARVDLAARAPVSEQTLFRIETDAELPRFETLEALLHALDAYPWQAQMLRDMWIARETPGLDPPSLSAATKADVLRLLRDLPYPAAVLDELYYLKAWNHAFAVLTGMGDRPAASHQPNGLLSALGSSGYRNSADAAGAAQRRALRRFFLHTALWSTQPGYRALLEQAEATLGLGVDWRSGLMSDETDDRRSRWHVAGGVLDAILVDMYQNAARSVVIRGLVPTRSSAGLLGAMVQGTSGPDREYIAPDWLASI